MRFVSEWWPARLVASPAGPDPGRKGRNSADFGSTSVPGLAFVSEATVPQRRTR
ncbi:hypothetical protein FraEuI1c_0451 [Pseudofrankia inefficax]|uniref:Uncharacterized protein n=1 Tax=Pseudofrankia inefficax (strain DSM 45817 / CECT 9037 / DDB 130130 / EuI1c) TaxID=298654 RepID=E3J9X2_PSEI1|nr:hypothetical protein FraEuI1c_0451 [Pseudofrankia inefficax]